MPTDQQVPESDPRQHADIRKRRWLLVGAGLYFLAFLNCLSFAPRVPYQAVILGGVLNFAILTTFILLVRRVTLRIQNRAREGSR